MEKKENSPQTQSKQYWCYLCENTITFKSKTFELKCPICGVECIEELKGDKEQITNFKPPTRPTQSKVKR